MLPAEEIRSNLGTWAVATRELPRVTRTLAALLPAEVYDPEFRGQDLRTTYFDTASLALRAARRKKVRYLTLRLRAYPGQVFAMSAKTEEQKYRCEVDPDRAARLLTGFRPDVLSGIFPPDLIARLYELAGDNDLLPCATVRCRRFAVEDAVDRFTLDVDVATDIGKRLPAAVLEFKSGGVEPAPAAVVECLPLIKLSKFLWATAW
jgi:hypothetical protein